MAGDHCASATRFPSRMSSGSIMHWGTPRLPTRSDAIGALRQLEGTLDEKRMVRLNAEAGRTKNYTAAADLYFNVEAALAPRPSGRSGPSHIGESFPHKLARWTLRHLQLAGFSLLLAVIVGIPLGIVASRGGPV